MADIFDQLNPARPTGSTGDIFDQINPARTAVATAPPQPRTFMANAMPPEQINSTAQRNADEQAFSQDLAQKQPWEMNLTNAAAAVPMNLLTGAAKVVSKVPGLGGLSESANRITHTGNVLFPTHGGPSAWVGSAVGTLATLPLKPIGMALAFGTGAAGNTMSEIEQRRAAGQDISGWKEFEAATLSAAINSVGMYAGGKIAGAASRFVVGQIPGLQAAFAAEGKAGAQRAVASLLVKAGVYTTESEAVMAGMTVANNANAKFYDPSRPLTAGMGEAMGVGAMFALSGMIHGAILRVRSGEITRDQAVQELSRQLPNAPPERIGDALDKLTTTAPLAAQIERTGASAASAALEQIPPGAKLPTTPPESPVEVPASANAPASARPPEAPPVAPQMPQDARAVAERPVAAPESIPAKIDETARDLSTKNVEVPTPEPPPAPPALPEPIPPAPSGKEGGKQSWEMTEGEYFASKNAPANPPPGLDARMTTDWLGEVRRQVIADPTKIPDSALRDAAMNPAASTDIQNAWAARVAESGQGKGVEPTAPGRPEAESAYLAAEQKAIKARSAYEQVLGATQEAVLSGDGKGNANARRRAASKRVDIAEKAARSALDALAKFEPAKPPAPASTPEAAKAQTPAEIKAEKPAMRPVSRPTTEQIPTEVRNAAGQPLMPRTAAPEAGKGKTWLGDAESAAKARIEERKKGGGTAEHGRAGGFAISPKEFAAQVKDYSIVGLAKIERGLRNFTAWSAEMLKDLGEEVKPYLKTIWRRSVGLSHQLTKTERDIAKDVPGAKDRLAAIRAHAMNRPPQPTVEKTFGQLLGMTLKAEARGSLVGYRAGAKAQVGTARELEKFAQENLPESERDQVMHLIAKARTPSQVAAARNAINRLQDKYAKQEAYGNLNTAVKTAQTRKMLSQFGDSLGQVERSINSPRDAADRATSMQGVIDAINTPMKDATQEANRQLIAERIDGDLLEQARRVMLKAGDGRVTDKLTPFEINTIANAIKHVKFLNDTANTLRYQGVEESRRAVADKIGERLAAQPTARQWGIKGPKAAPAGEDPVRSPLRQFMTEQQELGSHVIENIDRQYETPFKDGGPAHKYLVDGLRDGRKVQLEVTQEWLTGRNDIMRKAGLTTDTMKGRAELKKLQDPREGHGGVKLKLEDGTDLWISSSERMTLMAHLTDPNTRARLLGDVDPITGQRTNQEPLSLRRGKFSTKFTVTKADADKLFADATPMERELVKWDINYRDSQGGPNVKHDVKAEANRVFENTEGYSRLTRSQQFPRQRSDALRQQAEPDFFKGMRRNLENEGIFQHRAPEGGSPILVGDWFATTEKHIGTLARFIGLQEPYINAKMVLGDPVVKAGLARTRGAQFLEFMRGYLEDALGQYRPEMQGGLERVGGRVLRSTVSSVVRMRPTVYAKQFGRLLVSGAEVGPEVLPAFAKGYLPGRLEAFKNWTMQYWPEGRDRYERTTSAEFMPDYERRTGLQNGWGLSRMTRTQNLDMRTVMAAKDVLDAQARKLHPDMPEPELNALVARELTRIAGRTQNPVDPLDMSGLARQGRSSLFSRTLATLGGEKNAIFDLGRRAYDEAKATGDWKKAAYKIAIANIGNALWVTGVTAAGSWGWGKLGTKKDRKESWEYLVDVTEHAMGGLYGIGELYKEVKDQIVGLVKGEGAGFYSRKPPLLEQPVDNTIRAMRDISTVIKNSADGMTDQNAKKAVDALNEASQAAENLLGIPTAPQDITWKAYKKWFAAEKSKANADRADKADRADRSNTDRVKPGR